MMNTGNKKILSISIAAYNAEKYIADCLDSLCDESIIEKLDIIVVNDGSKDATEKITQKYVQKYPNSIRHVKKENGGWGSTVNKGMELAEGKYFKLLDVDDWYFTENLNAFVEFLEKVDADIVLSAFSMYDDNLGRVYAEKKYPFEHGKIYNIDDVINTVSDIQMHGVAVNTNIMKKADVHILEHCFYTDVQFVVENCCSADNITYFDKSIYKYRVGIDGQSISAAGLLKHMGDNKRVAERLINYMSENSFSEQKVKFLINRINYSITLEYYTYIILNRHERKTKLKEMNSFVDKYGIDYVPSSTEVRVVRKLGYNGCRVIHFCFECVRKLGKIFNVDFIQHA